jgi:hypothetical protein
MRNYTCWVQRHLDKETEQVRSTWLRYRGGHGTYIGVSGRTCVGVSDNINIQNEHV